MLTEGVTLAADGGPCKVIVQRSKSSSSASSISLPPMGVSARALRGWRVSHDLIARAIGGSGLSGSGADAARLLCARPPRWGKCNLASSDSYEENGSTKTACMGAPDRRKKARILIIRGLTQRNIIFIGTRFLAPIAPGTFGSHKTSPVAGTVARRNFPLCTLESVQI